MDYISLEKLIEFISLQGNYHVCIHDVSGILNRPCLTIRSPYTRHSMDFCTMAKSTQKGFAVCVHCKNCANHKAIRTQQAFAGLCAFGLYEAVKPVVINGKTVCIIYLGNIVTDRVQTLEQLRKACEKTQSPAQKMEQELEKCEITADTTKVMLLCELLDSYIRLLYDRYPDTISAEEKDCHWAVNSLKRYVDDNFNHNLTLKSVCRLYFVNEKYAGKLFKEQMGMSFHEYMNKIRLEKAARDLTRGKERIIDIALRCGFNNVTYFNRRFQNYFGMSPREYRRNSCLKEVHK